MREAIAQDAPKLLLATGARDWGTSALLGILLGAAGMDQEGVDEVAQMIESGDMAPAAAMPDELLTDLALPSDALAALLAAFELTRRASLPDPPGVISGPADVAAIARRELGGLRREHVLVIACNGANRPLRTILVAQGAVDRAPIPIREILNAVLRCDGRAFALAHNHPCGGPEPSDTDVEVTKRLEEASRLVGLRFLGHVVVAGDDYRTVRAINGNRKPR